MKKTFKFKDQIMFIEELGSGDYLLVGIGSKVETRNNYIWNYCDDRRNPDRCDKAMSMAYNLLIESWL